MYQTNRYGARTYTTDEPLSRHSNVLLRSAAGTSTRSPVATDAIAALLGRGDELLLAPQVLAEFWSVATRPTSVNGFGWPVDGRSR